MTQNTFDEPKPNIRRFVECVDKMIAHCDIVFIKYNKKEHAKSKLLIYYYFSMAQFSNAFFLFILIGFLLQSAAHIENIWKEFINYNFFITEFKSVI